MELYHKDYGRDVTCIWKINVIKYRSALKLFVINVVQYVDTSDFIYDGWVGGVQ